MISDQTKKFGRIMVSLAQRLIAMEQTRFWHFSTAVLLDGQKLIQIHESLSRMIGWNSLG